MTFHLYLLVSFLDIQKKQLMLNKHYKIIPKHSCEVEIIVDISIRGNVSDALSNKHICKVGNMFEIHIMTKFCTKIVAYCE